jgi:hypothetical protein
MSGVRSKDSRSGDSPDPEERFRARRRAILNRDEGGHESPTSRHERAGAASEDALDKTTAMSEQALTALFTVAPRILLTWLPLTLKREMTNE